ncbi:helix-turn-helix domain-containing protein [Polyangium sp. y55x31]|uniref:GlxA family transcriptional regulator n=1 Tax=Polyangium sp. y55x31 TaxID=3042688 RepID=UPI002482A739|nr:helix-turn-helix domain-containing protein [Polyangium sp. y55x31]MDI1482919.1 helix-turn-helix domain-containing protein [Polyangium sp. y55x31]
MQPSAPSIEIGILEYPGVQAAAALGLLDLLASASRLAAESGARAKSLSPQLVRVDPKRGRPPTPSVPFSALILPPSLGDAAALTRLDPLASWLADRHRDGTILVSVCAGAFLLGSTGLLAGRPATTHWALGPRFSELFPDVHLDTSRLVIEDGDIITAGGVMAWIDVGLMIVARHLGPSVVSAVARFWLVDPGGREQRHYGSFTPMFTHGDDAVLRSQRFLHARRDQKVEVAAMAKAARLTERTFLRRFTRATGHTPVEYLQLLRVERAREWLEQSAQSFDEIAWKLGYADAGAFRRVFQRAVGLSPSEYRSRFRVAVPPRRRAR